jgi:hypothetical protein
MSYGIPKTAGGQTSHYAGVNYWTLSDTIASTQMSSNEYEVLDFVKNITLNTGVVCDEYDERYHTHERQNTDPNTEDEFTASNACMYGRCNGTNCALNKLFVSYYSSDTEKNAISDWYKGSTITEYGADNIETGMTVQKLVVDNKKVTAIEAKSEQTGETEVICANKAVLLAAGVMGNAPLLLEHMNNYSMFGQPVITYINYELMGFSASQNRCDSGSVSGGIIVKKGQNGDSGFMSTLGICKQNNVTKIIWATPQSVNPKTKGFIQYENNTIVAQMNYNDTILNDLKYDFQQAVSNIYNITIDVENADFSSGAYHWTGGYDLSIRSRVKNFDNLFLADALAVTGPTSGWTSWNARVAGALAAFRAIKHFENNCAFSLKSYKKLQCCNNDFSSQTCIDLKSQYKIDQCCTNNYTVTS